MSSAPPRPPTPSTPHANLPRTRCCTKTVTYRAHPRTAPCPIEPSLQQSTFSPIQATAQPPAPHHHTARGQPLHWCSTLPSARPSRAVLPSETNTQAPQSHRGRALHPGAVLNLPKQHMGTRRPAPPHRQPKQQPQPQCHRSQHPQPWLPTSRPTWCWISWHPHRCPNPHTQPSCHHQRHRLC